MRHDALLLTPPSHVAGLTRLERVLAAPMAALALVFLILLGGALQSFVSLGPGEEMMWFLRGALLTWPAFAIELALHAVIGSRRWQQHLLHFVLPPLRIVCGDHDEGRSAWLPLLGWQTLGPELEVRVERALTLPMALISLTVLPVFSIERYGAAYVERWPALHFTLDAAESLVWAAFSVEFALRVSIAVRPFAYCLRHWVDLAIICLPFAAFLRLARLGQLARLAELANATRAYRLRGVKSRVSGKSPLKRWLRRTFHVPPALTLARLRKQLGELDQRAADLRDEIAHVETEGRSDDAEVVQRPAQESNVNAAPMKARAPRPLIVPRRRAA